MELQTSGNKNGHCLQSVKHNFISQEISIHSYITHC